VVGFGAQRLSGKFCRDWFDLMRHPEQRQSVKSSRELVQHLVSLSQLIGGLTESSKKH